MLFKLLFIFIIIITLSISVEYFNNPTKNNEEPKMEYDARPQCVPKEVSEDYPKNEDEIYDSIGLFKNYNLGANSNMRSIYLDTDFIRNTPKFLNRPDLSYNVGASNEGESHLNECNPCKPKQDLLACKNNRSIFDEDYCPLINTCVRPTTLTHSDSFRDPEHLDYMVPNKNFRSLRSKLTDKEINSCNIQMCESKKNEFQSLLSEFKTLYKNVKDSLFIEGLIDSDDNFSNTRFDDLKAFFANPMVHFYFRIEGNYEITNQTTRSIYPNVKAAFEDLTKDYTFDGNTNTKDTAYDALRSAYENPGTQKGQIIVKKKSKNLNSVMKNVKAVFSLLDSIVLCSNIANKCVN